MEPLLILALGIVSLFGQLQNYGIDKKQLEENPHLKDIRVRRHVDSQPYELKNKDYEKLQADFKPYALKNKHNEKPNVETQIFDMKDNNIEMIEADFIPKALKEKEHEKLHDESELYAQEDNVYEKSSETQPNGIEDKDDRKLQDLEESTSVKSILKGDRNIRKRYRRSYSAVSYQQSQSQLAAAGSQINTIDNAYGTKNNYYNTETTKYRGVKTVTDAYNVYGNNNGFNSYNNGYSGNNNGFNVNNNGFNGNTGTHKYARKNGRVSTTTPRVVHAQVIVNVGCPQFMKNVSIFGKKICVDDENIKDVEETEDYM